MSAGRPFCDQCFKILEDDEQGCLMASIHAPFWPRYFYETEVGDITVDGVAVVGRELFTFGYVLADFQKRDAVAHFGAIVNQRRRQGLTARREEELQDG